MPTTVSEQATDITATTATIHFTAGESGTLYAVAILDSASTTLTAEQTVTMAKAASEGTITLEQAITTDIGNIGGASLTGLSASSAYTVYLVLEDSATTPNRSSQATLTFTTTATPLAIPDLQDLSATTLTANTLISPNLTFTNDGGGALHTDRQTPNAGCTATGLPTGLTATRSQDATTCELSGTPALDQVGTHTVTLTARNSAGADATPATVTLTVLPATPTLTTTIISPESVTISLTPAHDGTASVLVSSTAAPTTATLLKAASGVETISSLTAGTPSTITITGLTPGVTYTASAVQTVTTTADFDSAISTSDEFTLPTLPAIIEVTATLTAITEDNSTATITITVDQDSTANVLLLPTATPDATTIKASSDTVNLTANNPGTVTVTGLEAGQTYTVHVITTVTTPATTTAARLEIDSLINRDTQLDIPALPVVTITAATATAPTTASVTITSDQVGTAYIGLSLATAAPPSVAILTGAGSGITTRAITTASTAETVEITTQIGGDDLMPGQSYIAYAVSTATTTTATGPVTATSLRTAATAFTTPAAPVIATVTVEPTDTRATVTITANQAGRVCAVALLSTVNIPTADVIKASMDAGPDFCADLTTTTTGGTTTVTVAGLAANQMYTAHAVITGTDSFALDSEVVSSDAFTTLEARAVMVSAIPTSDITATVTVTSNADGTAYTLVQPAGDTAPDVAAIKAGTAPLGMTATLTANEAKAIEVTGLTAETAYTAYTVVTVDSTDSEIVETDFATELAPVATITVSAASIGSAAKPPSRLVAMSPPLPMRRYTCPR